MTHLPTLYVFVLCVSLVFVISLPNKAYLQSDMTLVLSFVRCEMAK